MAGHTESPGPRRGQTGAIQGQRHKATVPGRRVMTGGTLARPGGESDAEWCFRVNLITVPQCRSHAAPPYVESGGQVLHLDPAELNHFSGAAAGTVRVSDQ
eukprot:399041-Hanusia_phi.AAC.2